MINQIFGMIVKRRMNKKIEDDGNNLDGQDSSGWDGQDSSGYL